MLPGKVNIVFDPGYLAVMAEKAEDFNDILDWDAEHFSKLGDLGGSNP